MESVFLRAWSTHVDDGLVSLFVMCILFLMTVSLLVYRHRESLECLSPRDGKSLPPGNNGLPFLGETHLLASQKDDFFRKRRTQFGAIFRTHLFGCPAVRVTGEANIKQLIQMEGHQLRSFYPVSVRRLLGDNSIATSSGPHHRERKRHLTQYLSRVFFQDHVSLFSGVVSQHLLKWNKQEVIDIYPACKALSAEVASRFLLDMELSPSQLDEIRSLLSEFTDNLFCFPVYFPGTSYYKAYNAKKRLLTIIENISKTQRPGNKQTSVLTETLQPTTDLHASQTQLEMLESLFELLFVGADNNGSGMFAIVNFLARHPEVVNKIHVELEEAGLLGGAVGDHAHEDLTLEQVRGLSYIRAVVKEAMRLMPPVGGFYRTVTEAFTINDFYIPKGWRVIAGIRETHEHDPSLTDPLRFDPDRWLSKDIKPAFLAFGGGSRVCPGKEYADILLRVFVINLMRTWSVDIVKDSSITMFPGVRPKDKMTVSLTRT
ncbi:cytochrome P450 26A1-like [Haliotis cracherodii]|uniref:cytochrome P450 26A1-like n=1 Tax=Haliotis cracherodii TaxID=6455 RepID=UPI0039EA02FA